MTQDRASGAAGNAYGRQMARVIARLLGATLISPNSNEAILNGERVVIKCAGPTTGEVGVVSGMLERIAAVLGSFEQSDGSVQVWRLEVSDYLPGMADSRSSGHRPGSVMKQRNKVFVSKGKLLAAYSCKQVERPLAA